MIHADGTPPASVLARAFAILDAFDEHSPRLTLSELAERCGLPVSTVHRLAAELTRLGALDRDEHRRYAVGSALWEVASLAPLSLHLREHAMPHLLELYETLGENVHVAILSGRDALYIARLLGPRSVPTISRMGGRLPLHTTGVGKVLLAFQGDDFLSEYLDAPLARPTRYSVGSSQRLLAEVEQIRARDFALTSQEMTLGALSVAVPIRHSDGSVAAAVGLVTHLSRSDAKRLLPGLRRAARGVERELGDDSR